ncbi:Xylose isomerase-like TIM barrel [Lacunisphaera limnophila]|uniref:Xylose isomerase-like TIM barrel n=1 Tax=Lacunisphaera limnophila TaxID=1838286 RepID=A0A1I7PHD2_9BACT|nr:sugar phosphate isomerase/epimerase [Lacunisphaera limnophila]AOS43009.1 Xylose isomerase-like TIM barrel [Lacunisphaera limnophila]
MKPIVALSSCWCSQRHQQGYEMMQEMAALGFEYVELSHGIKITLVPGILKAVEEGVIKVASCHNFCPLPPGVSHAAPNLYLPSSADARERDQWLRQSKRTVDFAGQVGAKKIVLHLGSVEFFWLNPTRKAEAYYDEHTADDLSADTGYQKMVAKALAKLKGRMPPYWAKTKASLTELLAYSAPKGLQLGFENREKFDELPLDADHPELIAAMAQPGACGYWHDTGHAQIKHDMGLLNHREHLEKNAPNAIGFHLHDVSADGRDHQPIGTGKIDFEMVSQFWRPEHTLVLEFSPRLTPEEVLSSKQRVEELLAKRFG